MRLVIISDTHFGDPDCTLVVTNEKGNLVKDRCLYDKFIDASGQNNDFLILLGDILDFSIAGYEDAYLDARRFFELIQNDKIANEIIYVPGNHDADIWHIVEHQVKIIRHMERGELPASFRSSVPGIIDDRKKSNTQGFTLLGVDRRREDNKSQYGGLYLDGITGLKSPTKFNFAYPNLYLITDNESLLLTHGHYLEPYWAFAGEMAMKIAQAELKVGGALDLQEMVGINFPLNQLACSGVGQSGPLTKVIRQVQRDVKSRNLEKVEKYLNRLDNEIDNLTRYPWYRHYLEWITDACSNKLKKMILDKIKESEGTRYNAEWIHNAYSGEICH